MSRVRTRVFDRQVMFDAGFDSVADLARKMEISEAQLSRVKRGEQGPGAAFMRAALRAFPGKTWDDLFYVEHDPEPATAAASS